MTINKKTIPVLFHTTEVAAVKIFYREAGDPGAPAVLLLHGFPTSSHMFRNLIPQLAGDFHIIAPDHKSFHYTFEHLAAVIGDFVEQISLKKFAVYIFDYGTPVGLRLALRFPDRISALISQNGNAYVEGLSDDWAPKPTVGIILAQRLSSTTPATSRSKPTPQRLERKFTRS